MCIVQVNFGIITTQTLESVIEFSLLTHDKLHILLPKYLKLDQVKKIKLANRESNNGNGNNLKYVDQMKLIFICVPFFICAPFFYL